MIETITLILWIVGFIASILLFVVAAVLCVALFAGERESDEPT